MNFEDLKKSLKQKISNNYMLVGTDMFLLSRATQLIVDALNINMPDLNYNVFSDDEIDMASVVQSLNTLPVFDERKCVLLNISVKTNISNFSALSGYLTSPNPSSVFIANVGDFGKDWNALKDRFEVVDCNKISQKFVDAFVVSECAKKGKQITAGALATLSDYTLGDMSKINNEVIKLVNYVGDRAVIEEKDVVEIVTKSMEFQIFELTEALARKDSVKVYSILDYLKAKKDSYRSLITLIYNHFRRLLHCAISKCNKSELATMLGVKEFAITKSLEQSRKFSKKQLKQINDLCMQLDYDVKLSRTSVDMAVEYLVLNILNS